jgi:asparagine synthase (glutamine-hydrolysing)
MCGIVGVYHYADGERPVDRSLLVAMTRTLAHRGPDGEGIFISKNVGLGHRRLAILDPSSAAAQPFAGRHGTAIVTYNGEIYNFQALRRELERRGHVFRSTSDTEVLVAGYEEWSDAVLERVEGIFAFALWDARRLRLLVARDPMGVKPLFYADDGRTLRFGSEIKAILRDPAVSRELDAEALGAFLTLSFTPHPATCLRAIRQLQPGECAVADRGGVRRRRYYRLRYAAFARNATLEEELPQFEALLDQVTKDQLVSDVPVGAFLSGGLDSAAVVRSMRRAATGPVRAMCVGFEAAGFDERNAAAATASTLGVDLEIVEMKLSPDLLPSIATHAEEPTADSSMLPVWLLCQAARRSFTVAMSGDGADETLAGYDTYAATLLAGKLRRLPLLETMLPLRMARMLPVSDGKYGLRRVATRFLAGLRRGPGLDHASWRIIFDESLRGRVFTTELQRSFNDPVARYAASTLEVPPTRERLTGLLHADTTFYLPNDMLVKVDRMSMAHGLEVRVPFLDIRMVQYLADLHARHKLRGLRGRKHILRESLRSSLPESVLMRPKSGFNAPIEGWLRGTLRDLLLDTVASERAELSRFLRLDALSDIVDEHRLRRDDHAHALFAVLMLALWLRNVRIGWRPTPSDPDYSSLALSSASR